MLVKLDPFPSDRGEHKKCVSCHHLELPAGHPKYQSPKKWLSAGHLLGSFFAPQKNTFVGNPMAFHDFTPTRVGLKTRERNGVK